MMTEMTFYRRGKVASKGHGGADVQSSTRLESSGPGVNLDNLTRFNMMENDSSGTHLQLRT